MHSNDFFLQKNGNLSKEFEFTAGVHLEFNVAKDETTQWPQVFGLRIYFEVMDGWKSWPRYIFQHDIFHYHWPDLVDWSYFRWYISLCYILSASHPCSSVFQVFLFFCFKPFHKTVVITFSLFSLFFCLISIFFY